MNPIVIIPARMGSSRLPGKPLADIGGEPMIVHTLRCAREAAVGPVVVACAEREVAEAVAAAGGRWVLTPPDLRSGSDRVFAALRRVDPERVHDVVVNLQGTLPAIKKGTIRAVLSPLEEPLVDIATLASEITDTAERDDLNVVKAVVALSRGRGRGRALYFSRLPVPAGDGPQLHHIGIYAFRRSALEHFSDLPPSPLEKREKLEQLRALEAGLRIEVALVDSTPLDVNTPADLERARALLAPEL